MACDSEEKIILNQSAKFEKSKELSRLWDRFDREESAREKQLEDLRSEYIQSKEEIRRLQESLRKRKKMKVKKKSVKTMKELKSENIKLNKKVEESKGVIAYLRKNLGFDNDFEKLEGDNVKLQEDLDETVQMLQNWNRSEEEFSQKMEKLVKENDDIRLELAGKIEMFEEKRGMNAEKVKRLQKSVADALIEMKKKDEEIAMSEREVEKLENEKSSLKQENNKFNEV